MKKMIGLALWLLAFALPFRFAILDTDELQNADGTTDNITGMLSFVAMVALLFIGYALVDSAGSKKSSESRGH